jgi:phage FluMu protein gp41
VQAEIGVAQEGEMRARVRSGLSARDYARYRECISDLDDAMASAVRRLIERAEGLGPSLQDDMGNILRAFPTVSLTYRGSQ